MKRFFLLPLFVVLSGCAPVQKGAGTIAVGLKQMIAQSSQTGGNTAYVNSLAPIRGVNGLVVAEPRAATPDETAFGAGCARWLGLHVGGQVELGTTPTWGQLDEARRTRRLPDLQLNAKNGVPLLNDLGASHLALGTLARNQLAFQLVDASGKPFGAPLQLSGTHAQIAARLPGIARQMAARLGVAKPALPSRCALSPEELAFLGRLPRRANIGKPLNPGDAARLAAVAPKDALAGVLHQRLGTGKNWASFQVALWKSAPQNALVVSEVLRADSTVLRAQLPSIDAFIKAHPNSLALAYGESQRRLQSNNAALRVAACERMLRLAPGELAFYELSDALSSQAQSIRRGAFSSQMSAAQRTAVSALYPKEQAVAARGVALFPRNADLQTRLAKAAAFNGDDALARASLSKALALDPGTSEAWNWGFELFHPKWGGSPSELVAFSKRAAQNAGKCAGQINASTMTANLYDVKADADIKPILETFVKNDPNNAGALRELGARYHYFDRTYRKAEAMYRRSLALSPNDARTLGFLADITQFVHGDPKGAGKLYYQAIKLNPGDGYPHANYARWLHLQGRPQAAVGEAKIAASLGFSDPSHPVWGLTGVKP